MVIRIDEQRIGVDVAGAPVQGAASLDIDILLPTCDVAEGHSEGLRPATTDGQLGPQGSCIIPEHAVAECAFIARVGNCRHSAAAIHGFVSHDRAIRHERDSHPGTNPSPIEAREVSRNEAVFNQWCGAGPVVYSTAVPCRSDIVADDAVRHPHSGPLPGHQPTTILQGGIAADNAAR